MKRMTFYLLHWLVTTFALLVSWSIGGMVAGRIAEMPEAEGDPANQAFRFLLVGALGAALITLLIIATNQYKGFYRWFFLVFFVFGIQFFLTQMETIFFAGAMGISGAQIAGIVLAGLVMSVITISVSLATERAYLKRQVQTTYSVGLNLRSVARPVLILSLIVYPMLYFVFGYFVAWQDPELRIFYTGSDELRSFFSQFTDSFLREGIYPFQILRSLIWILLSVPVIRMMGNRRGIVSVFGLITALLPTCLLFLPNPFMPSGVALTHFYETAASNFIWGVILAWTLTSRTRLKSIRVGDQEQHHGL